MNFVELAKAQKVKGRKITKMQKFIVFLEKSARTWQTLNDLEIHAILFNLLPSHSKPFHIII